PPHLALPLAYLISSFSVLFLGLVFRVLSPTEARAHADFRHAFFLPVCCPARYSRRKVFPPSRSRPPDCLGKLLHLSGRPLSAALAEGPLATDAPGPRALCGPPHGRAPRSAP